jgi:PIN domain nuclease of toxin-antitoxin system
MLLLDTHAVLWLDSGERMNSHALEAIDAAAQEGGVLVSPVSAWEIGLLIAKARISLDIAALAWFERFLALPGVRLTPLTVAAAITSSALPEPFHGDPADRLLVASAREIACPIVTRDRRILEYAETGAAQAIAC